MNRHHKPPLRRPQNPAYRQAFERLDAALNENTQANTFEKIHLARLALFGEAAVGNAGTVKIPD